MFKILKFFLVWRTSLFVFAAFSIFLFPQFGAKFPYFGEELIPSGLPYWVWGFGNFDGVHYLRIAQNGYAYEFTQAFFPLFPLLINFLNVFNSPLISGLLISNVFFLVSLFLLYKLFKTDFDDQTALKSIGLFLAFPTSFYFGAVYSESVFLFLTLLTFLLLRQKKFILSGIIGALASATRIYGVFLIVPMLIEFFNKLKEDKVDKKIIFKKIMGIMLVPVGLFSYMTFLKSKFNDPFYFLSAQPAFGAERSSEPFILLPQVLFRYIKIFFTVPPVSLIFLNAFIEFASTIFFLIMLLFSFRVMKKGYWFFTAGVLLLPTLTGTLSSMPRYVLLGFLVFPFIVRTIGKFYTPLIIFFILLQFILLSLFIRGYWVA